MTEYKNGDKLRQKGDESPHFYIGPDPFMDGFHFVLRKGHPVTMSPGAMSFYTLWDMPQPGETWHSDYYEFYVYEVFEGYVWGRERNRDPSVGPHNWYPESYDLSGVDWTTRSFKKET